jgi:hypothetical protein
MQGNYKAVIHYRMACAYAAKRDFTVMFEKLELADSLGFKSVHDVRLAETLGEAVEPGDDVGAIVDYLEGNLKSYPDHPGLLISAAMIYSAIGDGTSTEAMIDRLRQRDPDAADALRGRLFPGEVAIDG